MATRQLIFQQVYSHLKPIIPGQDKYQFFEDNATVEDNRIVTLTEHEIIKWVFENKFTQEYFIQQTTKLESVQYALEVQKPIIEFGQKPGDVDILMWPKGQPNLAVAIECKRAKVSIAPDGKEKANRLSEITKGIRQAKQLRELGFHKSYLLIFILTDGQHKKKVNSFFRYSDAETIKEIYNIPWHEELHEDVGVIYVQITQPSGLSYDSMYGFGICMDKEAKELEQSLSITKKINKILCP
ncbi:MAG: hypothetical protein ACJ77K_19270 [Bacteroidia bacterium]